jgi:hypothetical protein
VNSHKKAAVISQKMTAAEFCLMPQRGVEPPRH